MFQTFASIVITLIGSIATGERATTNAPMKQKPVVQTSTKTVFQGTVAIVTNSHLVLATKDERRTFVVPASTQIIVNKAEATIYDVAPGQFASVASTSSNGQLVASFINASRQY